MRLFSTQVYVFVWFTVSCVVLTRSPFEVAVIVSGTVQIISAVALSSGLSLQGHQVRACSGSESDQMIGSESFVPLQTNDWPNGPLTTGFPL